MAIPINLYNVICIWFIGRLVRKRKEWRQKFMRNRHHKSALD